MATDTSALIEDATFLADTGAGLTAAARRLGYTKPESLEKALERLRRNPEHADTANALLARLRKQDWPHRWGA